MKASPLSRRRAPMDRIARAAVPPMEAAVSGGEMLLAAGDVIAARLRILADGLADPRRADLVEMSLMGSEKVEALSASAGAWASHMGEVGARLTQGAVKEAGLASRAAAAMSTASTPMALAQAQWAYATGWWGRAAHQMLALNGELLKAHNDALRPIHAAATANARRLKG